MCLNIVFYLYGAFINMGTLLLMGIDKRRAKHQQRRIPENRFFVLAVLGGSLGILIGMFLFRHKTMHSKFTLGIPIILVVQILLLLYFIK